MKHKFFTLVFIIFFTISAFSQTTTSFLKTVKLGMVKSNYDFTPEWQYVSSDLYLFNTQKFADVVNAIIEGKKMHWWRKNKYDLQNILITMNTQGLGTYDKVTFPLFNFVLEKDEQTGGYKVTTESNEVIRIVDNYPAPAIKDFITAKIDVKVITKDNEVQIYKLAASQLETISQIATNPTGAVMQLVGEFGKMIESAADKKEYHFKSTIRIFENDNFNQRLHSIVVFAFVPSTENEFKLSVNLNDLQKAINSDTALQIDRKFLYNYIKIKKYPYVVIVNYKSKYIPDVPEDIDFDIIKQREAKLQADYAKKIINPEIYELEKQLLDFLKLVAKFQLDLNNYQLNLQNRTTEDFSMFYYYLLRDYWNIKNTYYTVLSERKGNQIFSNDFRKYYDKFLTKTQLSLEQNINLQNIKALVDLLYELEDKGLPNNLDSATMEKYLAILNSVPLPKSEQNSPEIQLVNKWRNNLEQQFYDREFRSELEKLQSLPVNDQTYKLVVDFQTKNSKTQCQLCLKKMNDFVTAFMQKYHQYRLDKAKANFEKIRLAAKGQMISITKRLSCLKQNLANYPGQKPEYIQLIEQDAVRLDDQRQTLLGLLNRNYVFTSETEIDKVAQDIVNLQQKITDDLNSICQQEPDLCDCSKPKQPAEQNQPAKNDTISKQQKPQVDTLKIKTDTVQVKQDTVHKAGPERKTN